jgi:hypothetical protein
MLPRTATGCFYLQLSTGASTIAGCKLTLVCDLRGSRRPRRQRRRRQRRRRKRCRLAFSGGLSVVAGVEEGPRRRRQEGLRRLVARGALPPLSLLELNCLCVEQDVARLEEFLTTPGAGGVILSSPERTLSFCKISSLLPPPLPQRSSEYVYTRCCCCFCCCWCTDSERRERR